MTVHRRLLLIAALTGMTPPMVVAQGGPPPHVRATVMTIESMLGSTGDAWLRRLVAEKFTASYRASAPIEAHLERLEAIRAATGGQLDGVSLERDGEGLVMTVEGKATTRIRLVLDDKGLIEKIALIEEPKGASPPSGTGPGPSPWTGVTWETLEAAAKAAESAGFSGTLLARRDGREIVKLALGQSDRDGNRPTALNTIYCIGSTPIDFTVTGIMLLGQRGKLRLDDPIGTVFPSTPPDKRALTIRHLLTGKSGLPDFFHTAADWDPDLAWVDRETAVRRILGQRLLFAPGTGQRHSHAAFVLLAALIDRVAGTTYQEFVRKEILAPLGMTRTGFYGEHLGLPAADFAVGYGASTAGVPNIPPNWGPTSWLVMGSGGMMSTLEDMDRYYQAIDQGRLLTGEWARWQQGARVGVGGSDRGFFIYRGSDGKGGSVLYLMNGEGRSPGNQAMTQAFNRLVMGR